MTQILDATGVMIDAIGVLVIVLAAAIASLRFLVHWREPGSYTAFRHGLGRGIILGLEFLVAADIIRTVAITPTLQSVAVLGLIVLIRTFLSFALEVELEGWPPWHRRSGLATARSPLQPYNQVPYRSE